MADVITGKTEIDAVSQELVSSIVQDYLIQDAKLLSTVMDFSPMAGPGMDKIKIPRTGGFTVNDKAENTAVDAQSLTYATDDLDLNKHKVIQVLAEDQAILQARVAMVQDIAMRAGKNMALALDKDIIVALEAASANAPDHRLAYGNTTSLGQADILKARELLNIQNVPMSDRFMGISPASETALLTLSDFVRADSYGSSGGLREGELGRIYGFTVIMHTGFADLKSLFWHKSHVAVAIQQSLRYQTESALAHLATRHSFDQLYGCKTLDSGKRAVLFGTAA